MTKARSIVCTLGTLFAISSIAHGAEPFCEDAINELRPKTFLAKEPLYDTKVAADGIVHLERDKEEIRKGARLNVVDIECEEKILELTVKPVAGGSKVEIVFFFSIAERRDENGKELFEKMLSYVFEKDDSQ